MGDYAEQFEQDFAARHGSRFGIATNSGTAALEAILRSLEVEGGEVVVPTNTFAATAFAVIGAGARPAIGTIHGYRPGFFLYRYLNAPLGRMMNRLSARTAVSTDARDWARRYFPGEYHIISDGVDTERFGDPDLKPIGELDDGRPNVLFVGRLEPRKGSRTFWMHFHR